MRLLRQRTARNDTDLVFLRWPLIKNPKLFRIAYYKPAFPPNLLSSFHDVNRLKSTIPEAFAPGIVSNIQTINFPTFQPFNLLTTYSTTHLLLSLTKLRRRFHKFSEQRMRSQRSRFQFRMELSPDEPRVIFQFGDLHKISVG